MNVSWLRLQRSLLWLVSLLALSGLAVLPAPAQEPPASGSPSGWGRGFVTFRHILGTYKDSLELQMVPYEDPEAARRALDPAHSVLIVLGDPGVLEQLNAQPGGKRWLNEFVSDGGTLLIATDRKLPVTVQGTFGIGVGGILWQKAPGAVGGVGVFTSRGETKPECLLVDQGPSVRRADPFLFSGAPRVATNLPSSLLIGEDIQPGRRLSLLGQLPRGLVQAGGQRLSVDFPLPFMVGGHWGRGRVLILADHDVFTDGMMDQNPEDSNNIEFTKNCLDWLTDPVAPGESRKELLLLINGDAVTDLEAPDPNSGNSGIMDDAQFLKAVNEFIDAAQQDDLPNKVLARNVLQRQVLTALAMLLSVGLILYGWRKLARARFAPETGLPLLGTALARLAPAGGPLEARTDAMLRGQNLTAAARSAARQFFAATVGEPEHLAAPGRIEVQAKTGERPAREAVERLWQLAYGTAPATVTSSQFAALLAELRRLWTEVKRGTVTLEHKP